MRLKTVLAAAAFAAVSAAPLHAQLTQVTARNQILNASTFTWGPSEAKTNPFSRTDIGLTVTVAHGTRSASFETRVAGTNWAGGFSTGDQLVYLMGGNQISLSFSTAITGFAAQLWNDFGGGNGQVTAEYFRNGSSLGSFGFITGGGFAANANQATVFGAIDAGGFDAVRITSTGGSTPGIGLNQLSISNTTVPEPSTYALMGAGLAAMALVARRRRATA